MFYRREIISIPRVLDAMKEVYVPFEAFKVRPYELVKRMEGKW